MAEFVEAWLDAENDTYYFDKEEEFLKFLKSNPSIKSMIYTERMTKEEWEAIKKNETSN